MLANQPLGRTASLLDQYQAAALYDNLFQFMRGCLASVQYKGEEQGGL